MILLCGLLFAFPPVVQGQTEVAAGVVGGAAQYDLSGTGTVPFGGLRVDVVPERARYLVLEAGIHTLRYETQAADFHRLWFPEGSVQLQLPGRVARPYLGLGAGHTFGSEGSAPTLSASVGSRFRVAGSWSLRTELRVRSVDPWVGTTADWGLGLSRTLGRRGPG
jgi:hypothetical protein